MPRFDCSDVVARDRQIPGLGVILDSERFSETLHRFWPDAELGRSDLTYVRYKPGVSCLVMHRIDCSGHTIDVLAKAFSAHSEADPKIAKARNHLALSIPSDRACLVLEKDRVVVSPFPYDRRLPALSLLDSAEARRRLLARVFDDDPSLTEATLSVLSYKPERRLVARVDGLEGHRSVLKFYTHERFARAGRSLKALSSGGSPVVPHRIGRSRRHGVLALEWLEGQSLRELHQNGKPDRAALLSVGAALSELHCQPAELLARSRAFEASQLRELATRLGFLLPSLASRAERLAENLGRWLVSQPAQQSTIHGDFYDKQLLVDSGGVAFVDLDELVLGDPRADLGLFLAHLERDVGRESLTESDRVRVGQVFLEGYVEASGSSALRDLDRYIAVGLFQLSHEPFRRGDSQWEERTQALIEKVEAYGSRSPVSPVAVTSGRR